MYIVEDLSVLEDDLAQERQLNNVLTDEISRLTGNGLLYQFLYLSLKKPVRHNMNVVKLERVGSRL